MKRRVIGDSIDHVSEAALRETGLKLHEPGAVMVVTRGMILAHTFPVALNSVPVTVNQDMKVLRPAQEMNAGYLAWMLQGLEPLMLSMTDESAHGTKALRTDQWANLLVPVPPSLDQQRIANFLDVQTARIDALIAEKEQLLERLAEFRKAVISEATTRGLRKGVSTKPSGQAWLGEIPEHWRLTKLKHLGDALIGLTYTPEDVVDGGDGVLVLRASNVQGGRIVLDDNVYVTCAVPDRLRVRAGDILICSRNGSRALIGKNAVIEPEQAGVTFGAFMTVFRSPDNYYIRWLLNSPLFDFHSASFFSSTINQLTTGNLNSLVVPLPPEEERREIDAHLSSRSEQVDMLSRHTNEHIDRLREYRSSLISAAVTGQLDICAFQAKLPEAA
jgi:type I restriction enzyme S subunit